jgi:hypothetical protein
MTAEPLTFTRAEAEQLLCPFRDKPCVADRCAVFQWTTSGLDRPAEGKCGMSPEPPR